MAKILLVLYDDPVTGYPSTYARDDIPKLDKYPDGQTMPSPNAIDFTPGELLGSVSGELGLRKFLEAAGHTLGVTSDKDGPDSAFERELPDADVVISQPFWPAYLTSERIAKAANLKMAITAGIGSDHVDLQAAMDRGITVAEVTYCNSISVSEHVVMMILALVRNYIPSYQWVIDGGWNIADCVARSYDVEGMTIGTVGAGRIGSAVLRRLHPFEVELLYTDRLPPQRRLHGPSVRCRHHQYAPSPRDGAPVQRRPYRHDEARCLSREHSPWQDLRPRRRRPRPPERPARRVRRRRLVPATRPSGPPLAHNAQPRHDAPRLRHVALRSGPLRCRSARDPRVLVRWPPDPR